MNKPTETNARFFASTEVINTNRMFALLLLVGGAVFWATVGILGFLIPIGAILLATTMWAQRTPLVTVHADYLEIKRSLGAGKQLVRTADIQTFEDDDPRAYKVHVKGIAKPVRLPTAQFSEESRAALRTTIRSKIAGSDLDTGKDRS